MDQDARARVVAALECVDWVTLFDEETPEELITEVRPDVLVKGGDYSEEEVAGAGVVRGGGGRVVILPLVPGYSTSALVESHPEPGRRSRAVNLLLATRSAAQGEGSRTRSCADGWRGDLLTRHPGRRVHPLLSRAEESLEPFDTFEENAASKARLFRPPLRSGHGRRRLGVGGRRAGRAVPGVRTRRFAPRERYPGPPPGRSQQPVSAWTVCGACARPRSAGPATCAWPCFFDPRDRPRPRTSGARPRGGFSMSGRRGSGRFRLRPHLLRRRGAAQLRGTHRGRRRRTSAATAAGPSGRWREVSGDPIR